MMRFLFAILLVCSSLQLRAQMQAGDWWLGGGSAVNLSVNSGFRLFPEIQYVINPDWSLGLQFVIRDTGLEHGEIFARWHFSFHENWFFYMQGVLYAELHAFGVAGDAGLLYKLHPRWMIYAQTNFFSAGTFDTQAADSWFVNLQPGLLAPRLGLQFRLNK